MSYAVCTVNISVLLPYHQSLCVLCIVIYVYHTARPDFAELDVFLGQHIILE